MTTLTRLALTSLILIVAVVALARGGRLVERPVTEHNAADALDRIAGTAVPGLQYVVVSADETLFEYAGGWADIRSAKKMTPDTTLMAYSMTKTLTAVAVMQLVEAGKLRLDDEIDRHLPDTPYGGRHITVRQLLDHTAGLPNPVPLRWAHLSAEAEAFDENAALAQVLRDNAELSSAPGQAYRYSNIGYWLLGKIVEEVTGQPFTDYMRRNVLAPLGLSSQEAAFVIPAPANHASGYLAKYSFLNLAKGFVMDSKFWGGYDGNWLRFESHYLNGPAFGGLIGSARGFARFLQDQLRPASVLLSQETKRALETPQTDAQGALLPMTLGWHVGKTDGVGYLFKEGGGGGFHGEMRLYPTEGVASVVIVNSTEFDTGRFLDRFDPFSRADAARRSVRNQR